MEVKGTDLTVLTETQVDDLFSDAWSRESRAFQATLHYTEQVEKGGSYYQDALDKAECVLTTAREDLSLLNAEWDRRGGWSRYWLVVNYDGHVHRERSCSTTFPTTQWAFPTQLSGMTEDEMVTEIGHMACTVCFPDAPVHPAFVTSAAEAEAAEKAKKNAQCSGSGEHARQDHRRSGMGGGYATCHVCGKRGVSVSTAMNLRAHQTPEQDKAVLMAKVAADPKKILSTSGELLRDASNGEIKTVVTARKELADALWNLEQGREKGWQRSYREVADEITEALMAKQGQTRDEVLASVEKSLATKRKRGW